VGGEGGQAGSAGGAGEGGGMGGMGGAGTGGAGGVGGSPQAICPATGKGPAMVLISGPNGDDFCVDATEVSVEQYNAWLVTDPSVDNQGPACDAWNTSFGPSTDQMNFCDLYDFPMFVAKFPKRPVRCVDWCDAEAFCKWAGKRLCGTIGGGEGAFNNPAAADVDEWYRACSQAGARDFPYGEPYDGAACVGSGFDGTPGFEPGKDIPQDVGSTASCEGGYTGLFDMSGNVWEWEGSCNGSDGNGDTCLIRGGSYFEMEGDLGCAHNVAPTRDTVAITMGFRCCGNPL